MIFNWLIFSSYTPKRCNRPSTPPPQLPLVADQFGELLSTFNNQCWLVFAHDVRVAAASLSPTSFINFNTTTSSPTPFLLSQESTRSPSHRIILRFALNHARIGAGDSSGRVCLRYTAFRKTSLGGRHTCSSTALMRVPHLVVSLPHSLPRKTLAPPARPR